MIAKGIGRGERLYWESGISRCKLVYVEWIKNKILLYSAGYYIQYPMTNYDGKEYGKELIYTHTQICITEPLCCTEEINTML